jgi:hypothetical protein
MDPPPKGYRLGGVYAVLLLWAATALIWIVLGADGIWRARDQDRAAAALCAHLHLTAPACYPAGHALRHPETQAKGIPAHYTPRLPLALTQTRPRWLGMALDHWETLP